ncbi:MAG: cytosine permease [Candidatus Hodarchaeaceae archaeon]|nr:cytosine permease [Candidatus Hodarchaeaceae archaeon]
MEKYEWKDKFGDNALVPVPLEQRRSAMASFLIFTGVLACIAAIMAGGTLGSMFSLKDLIIVSVVGCAILAIIGGLTAVMGVTSGCSTYVNMRWPYGRIGSWILGTIVAGLACGIGWFAIQTWFFGIFANALIPIDIWIFAAIGGALMILTAAYGFRGLGVLSYLVVPMFLLLAGVGFMVAVGEAGGLSALLAAQPATPAPTVVGITAVVGTYIAGSIITQDITRYCTSAAGGATAWIIQVLILMPYMFVGAGSMMLVTGELNIAAAMAAAGLGVGAFLIVFFGQWTTNDNNLYSGALSVNLWAPIKKWILVVILGMIGTVVAVYYSVTAGANVGAASPFMDFLTLLGKALPAIGGGLIADYYIYQWYKGVKLSERYRIKPGMEISELNWVGLVAVAAGVAGGFLIPWGIAAINSILLAFLVYIILSILLDKAGIPITIGKHKLPVTGT